jgi:hypothetical protein
LIQNRQGGTAAGPAAIALASPGVDDLIAGDSALAQSNDSVELGLGQLSSKASFFGAGRGDSDIFPGQLELSLL